MDLAQWALEQCFSNLTVCGELAKMQIWIQDVGVETESAFLTRSQVMSMLLV